MYLRWLPRGLEGVARVLSCPMAVSSLRGYCRGGIGPARLFSPVSMGFNAAPCQRICLRSHRSKKSRFFMRPPRPDDACRRFKNPGETALENPTSETEARDIFARLHSRACISSPSAF